MLFKKECPICGAKNDKERTVCIECGAPLASGQVEGRLTEVPSEGKPNLTSAMKQPTGQKRSVWFWVGVTLLFISALFWLMFILPMIIDKPEDAVYTVVAGLIFTGIPIGIGIYGIRRRRKVPAVEVQRGPESAYTSQPSVKPSAFKEAKGFKQRKVIVQETPTGSEIVIKMPWWFRVGAWFALVVGVPLFLMGLGAIISEGTNTDLWIPGLIGLLFVLLGIWMVGMTTKVVFNQPPGYMTVTRGQIPLFLWFLRTRVISREEAKSVFVGSVERDVSAGPYGGYGTRTAYEVKVITRSGKRVTLYSGWKWDKADYLARRIREFGHQ